MHALGHGQRQCVARFAGALIALSTAGNARADATLDERSAVVGAEVTEVSVNGTPVGWSAIEAPREPGPLELQWRVTTPAGGGVEVPACAGRGAVAVDGAAVRPPDAGPLTVPLSEGEHVVSVRVTVGGYERRVACGSGLRVGTFAPGRSGLVRLSFTSPHATGNGGHAVTYLPPTHDRATPAAVLVMPHPWNGTIWTYAAYRELLDEASTRDVVLLFPSGLGNSLYTADAEDEVLRALDALASVVAVDPARVSIAGASMGGAGATTIGFHHPDRFASVTSFFGDAKYDLATYVRAILKDERGTHLVNAYDVADNARWLPVWLVHGEDDHTSPIFQSEVLARALTERGFTVRFDRAPGFGHSGALVAKYAREVVARAATARVPEHPPRVTYRSVRAGDTGAYGVRIERGGAGDAYVDVEAMSDGSVHVHRADDVRAIRLAPGALGVARGARVVVDGGRDVAVEWMP